MVIYADCTEFAEDVLPKESAPLQCCTRERTGRIEPLVSALLGHGRDVYVGTATLPAWTHLFLTADSARSQCDQLIALCRDGYDVPDHIACLARTGSGFHGFKGRSWSAAPGNIHLAVHFAPGRAIERFEVAFTILAALSVAEAIDEVPGLQHRAGIRWVNDIIVDGSKVGGVLAYTQTLGRTVTSAILGVGLNVETTPCVKPTPFVPAVGSLRGLSADGTSPSLRTLLGSLLEALQRNYELLLQAGYRPLLAKYRQRSTAIGSECTVCTEESDDEPVVIAAGRLIAIGDGLELHLDSCERPITRGRLLVGRPQMSAH